MAKSNLNCHPGIQVSLKKFVESKIDALKELIAEQLKGRDSALSLQAKEYERRLEDLNHEHTRDRERKADYVGLEKFDSFKSEFLQYKESNDKAVDAKAKSLADQVDQKATAAITLVNGKAEALAKEFLEYKSSQATAVALAAGKSSVTDPELTHFMAEMRTLQKDKVVFDASAQGSSRKMSAVKAAAISAVGVGASLIWVISLAINIYMALHYAK
jgi:hypothetical protein